MVLPCASVMVTMVLLNEAFTCATPAMMFLRSRRRGRAPVAAAPPVAAAGLAMIRFSSTYFVTFFLPAIGLAGPLRGRAFGGGGLTGDGETRGFRQAAHEGRHL